MKIEDEFIHPAMTTLPAWYELGFISRIKQAYLTIRIHKMAFEHLVAIDWPKTPIAKFFEKKFNCLFRPPTLSCNTFGYEDTLFGPHLERVESKDPNWTAWEFELPVFIGKSEDPRCSAYVLRATLSTLFLALSWFGKNTGWKEPQLLLIESLMVESDLHGGSFSVTLTPTVTRWLSGQEDNSRLGKVEEAMMISETRMFQREKIWEHYGSEFRAMCRKPKWINFTIPGNACGLDPEAYREDDPDRGYRLDPHNVDSSVQQLTFLAGLARLHEIVREETRTK